MIKYLRSYFSNIYSYIWINKNNRLILFFIIASTIIAATNLFGIWEKPPHKGWVVVSLIVTLVYTAYFFISGGKNGWFDKLGGYFSVIITLAHIPLVLITFLVTNEYIHIFEYTPKIEHTIGLMCVFAFIFSLVNWSLYMRFKEVANSSKSEKVKNQLFELSENFKKGVFMSDFPAAVVFLILFVYAVSMDNFEQIEYFLSGAVAFQILASNFVWVFNDDIIYTKIEM